MTAREIVKPFSQSPSNVKTWAVDYRNTNNSNTSTITFPVSPYVGDDVNFQGLRGGGLWTLAELNITGDATISDCVNISVLNTGQVDSWTQKSGNVTYHGATVGNGTTHYDIAIGDATIHTTQLDQSTPSTFSIVAGGEGIANVTVQGGVVDGSASSFDLRAELEGFIYYEGDLVADGGTFDPSSPGRIMDQTGFLVIAGTIPSGSTIIRNSFMHIASESPTTVYPVSSDIQLYDLEAFEADTTNRPVIYTQNTLGFDPLLPNGGFDITWIPVGFEFTMWMLLARFGPTSINQYIKMHVLFFNSSDVEIRHTHGNSNWLENDNNNRNIYTGYRQSVDEEYFTVGSFSPPENLPFPGGQDNEYTITKFAFLCYTGF